MSKVTARLVAAQAEMARAAARVDELARQIPEPVASVSDAIMSLAPEDRAALWAVREEAMQVIAQQATDARACLTQVTARGRELQHEFQETMPAGDFERLTEIANWIREHDEEVGQLKTLIVELDALRQEFEANPTMPPLLRPEARYQGGAADEAAVEGGFAAS